MAFKTGFLSIDNTIKMATKPRLFSVLSSTVVSLLQRLQPFGAETARYLLALLVGFFFGNLFASFIHQLRSFVGWDGFLAYWLIFVFECASWLSYRRRNPYSPTTRLLNYLKIGSVFGIYIDAFKVGS